MKKFLLVVTIFLTFGAGIALGAAAVYDVTINGKEIKEQPIIVKGKMYIPARSYLTAMGYKIHVTGRRVIINADKSIAEPNQNGAQSQRVTQPRTLPPKNEKEKQAIEKREQARKNFNQYLKEHPEFAEYLGMQPDGSIP